MQGGKELTAKIVLLGESAVGKSSIVLKFVRDEFVPNQEATIGAAFLAQTVHVEKMQKSVKYEIWDTAGQERYRSLAPMYYRGASAALIVYDITSADSLIKAQTWIRELRKNGDPNIILFLVGNKCDLNAQRTVSEEDGRRLMEEEGAAFFMETSAKSGINVQEVFQKLAEKIIDVGVQSRGGAGVKVPPGARTRQKKKDDCAC